MDEPEGGGLDGGRTRAYGGFAPTRLGGPEGNRLVGAEAASAPPRLGYSRRAGGVQKKLAAVVTEEAAKHPDKPVEVWATDEHRIGLKPIIRRVWAPKGQRPIALGHHRYKWLYVTAFVQPISGETFWYVSNGVSKPFFAALLALFAREAGAGRERIIVLGLDNAGWHTEPNLVVPEGIRPVYLPRYSPERRPAEPLWPVLDEPLANRPFATLPLSSKSSPRVVVFSIAISSNPAQTSTGGPSQTSRPNQPKTVSLGGIRSVSDGTRM